MARIATSIPAQALPPDKQPAAAPPPIDDILPSGLRVQWRMPDPFALVAFDGIVPDPLTAGAIALLIEEKAYTPQADPLKLRRDANGVKGMYAVAAAMLVAPQLDPLREWGDATTLGRREIGLVDVAALYWRFRVSTRLDVAQPAGAAEPDGPADAAPDRE